MQTGLLSPYLVYSVYIPTTNTITWLSPSNLPDKQLLKGVHISSNRMTCENSFPFHFLTLKVNRWWVFSHCGDKVWLLININIVWEPYHIVVLHHHVYTVLHTCWWMSQCALVSTAQKQTTIPTKQQQEESRGWMVWTNCIRYCCIEKGETM